MELILPNPSNGFQQAVEGVEEHNNRFKVFGGEVRSLSLGK